MPEQDGTTALVVLLPAADAVLDAVRRVAPDRVRPGVGAHVTVLYPFVPVAEAEGAVRALAASYRPVPLTLGDVVTRDGFAAVPVPELQPLVDAALARWPQVRPYGGRFGANPPAHLTLAMGATDAELDRLRSAVAPLFPIRARVEALHLVERTGGGWRPRLAAPFPATP
ncbi:MAG TPA: 2'-5' RNA ligase family protein [Actinocatenispora sp.]